MESEHLNPLPDDPHFEHLLRTRLAAPPLDDAGFTGRVLGALPAPAARAARRRTVLIVLGVAAALAVSYRGDLHALTEWWDPASATTALLSTGWGDASTEFYLKLLGAALLAWWVFREELRRVIDV
jgi:hypothetical protein